MPHEEPRGAHRLDRFIAICQALMSADEVDAVISLILESGIELFEAEGCSLALLDREADELSFVAMEGKAKAAPFRIPAGQGIAGQVASTGKALVVPDVQADPRFFRPADEKTGFITRSIACVPLRQEGRVSGVMSVLNTALPGGIDDSDLELLAGLAGLAGAALNRAHTVDRLRNERALMREERDERHRLAPSKSPGFRQVLRTARTAARSDATVLLLGESGTGKELLARTVHEHSGRREGPFIAINCVALAPSLLESELFGHEKGAFTGASSRKQGKFELASGGSLFLDEIGELRPELQAKLLRALQEREVERVGGVETIRVDVRIIAATNRDLRAAMAAREFREDLYYRLNVVSLEIPPLRQRREDIPALCRHFLQRYCAEVKRPVVQIPDEVMAALGAYDWPGNVRELANTMERLVVLGDGGMAGADLPAELLGSSQTGARPRPAETGPLPERVRDFKRDALRQALAASHGNQRRAARALGIQQSNLSRMMKTLGLR